VVGRVGKPWNPHRRRGIETSSDELPRKKAPSLARRRGPFFARRGNPGPPAERKVCAEAERRTIGINPDSARYYSWPKTFQAGPGGAPSGPSSLSCRECAVSCVAVRCARWTTGAHQHEEPSQAFCQIGCSRWSVGAGNLRAL